MVDYTQRSALPHITRLVVEQHDDVIIIDAATRRNLEPTDAVSGRYAQPFAGLLDCVPLRDGQSHAAALVGPPAALISTRCVLSGGAGRLSARSGRLDGLRDTPLHRSATSSVSCAGRA